MEEEWQDKGCSATNMKWNPAEPAVLAMTFLGLTAREMWLTSLIVMVNFQTICLQRG